ncbi:MAG: LacI family DNA-binding transcriptional regulator [Pseudomonadota bacterium]
MARVNMRELARTLGVDRSTISRALSADKAHLVGTETRDRIRAAAEHAGYRPDLTAAALRRGRSNTIGILVSDLENETFITVIRRIVAELNGTQQEFTTPLIGETRDLQRTSRELLDQFLARRVDAIISLASSETDAEMLGDASRHVPVVLAIRRLNGVALPTATCDDEAGGAMVAEHFHARGHRTVCQIKGPTISATFVDRAQGFSDAAARLGLSEHPTEIVATNATTTAGRSAAELVLGMRPRPTAVFAHNDALALGMLETMRSTGLSCPGDISVAGYNNTQIAKILATPLTTVDYPVEAVSIHAALTTRNLIADRSFAWTNNVFQPALVIRKST